jgi:ATP-dependent DNA helicase RecG
VLATDDHIKRFAIAAKGGAENIVYEGKKYLELFDLNDVEEFIKQLNSARGNVYHKFTTEEVLVKQKAIIPSNDVTLFGLLAFSKEQTLQEIVAPTLNITVTQYPGPDKINEEDLSETYTDNREIVGNVNVQFSTAFEFIKTKLPIRGTIEGSGKRRDSLIIPEIALREALANAIAHRDYATHTANIQVDIFADRVEIINPGTSLVPLDQLEDAPSATRNPLLMSHLKDRGVTEQKARGIRTIRLAIRNAGLLEPTFQNINESFKVTLFSSAFISNRDFAWLRQFSGFKLNERQHNALVYVKNNPAGIGNSEYRNINSMKNVRDDKKANKELNQLVKMKLLMPIGENRSRRYIIAPFIS